MTHGGGGGSRDWNRFVGVRTPPDEPSRLFEPPNHRRFLSRNQSSSFVPKQRVATRIGELLQDHILVHRSRTPFHAGLKNPIWYSVDIHSQRFQWGTPTKHQLFCLMSKRLGAMKGERHMFYCQNLHRKVGSFSCGTALFPSEHLNTTVIARIVSTADRRNDLGKTPSESFLKLKSMYPRSFGHLSRLTFVPSRRTSHIRMTEKLLVSVFMVKRFGATKCHMGDRKMGETRPKPVRSQSH
jgi:hypothetical protein